MCTMRTQMFEKKTCYATAFGDLYQIATYIVVPYDRMFEFELDPSVCQECYYAINSGRIYVQ